jgi:hypothetical protein
MALQLISTEAAERVHGYPINPGGAVLKYAVIDLWNMAQVPTLVCRTFGRVPATMQRNSRSAISWTS